MKTEQKINSYPRSYTKINSNESMCLNVKPKTIKCLENIRSKSLQAINAGEGVEKREPSYTVGGNAN